MEKKKGDKKSSYWLFIYKVSEGYLVILMRKILFFYIDIKWDYQDWPYGRTVINLQEKYNIPDNQVKFKS